MTEQKQITLEEALELVTFRQNDNGAWFVEHVKGDVHGDVWINVLGRVLGNVWHVQGDVLCHVGGHVRGTISGRTWKFVETPREKLKRLIEEGALKSQLLEALNQLEDSDD